MKVKGNGTPATDHHDPELLRARLNLETGRLPWSELQRHFARGAMLKVDPKLDLVEVAAALVRDDKPRVQGWADHGKVTAASDEDAARWNRDQSELWAIVVAPWVLVQERAGTTVSV